jgi:DNA-binding winged helix-turn-helix (wHTH) protein
MLYSFEDFVLDTDRQELRRGSASVHLEPQMFNLLELLIRYRDRVVSKDELLEAVWKRKHVSESTLTSRINLLRKAIGDAGEANHLIKTVQKSGYRFVGQISQTHGAGSDRSLTEVDAKQVSKVDAHQDNNREDDGGAEASTPLKRRLPVALRLPPPPALLIGRGKDLLEVKARIAAAPTPSERRITVVRGWPGVGKTSLVNMLANDKELMEAFPDGVLWAAFGQSPNLLGELTSWSHALGTPINGTQTEIADVTFRVRNLLHDRQVLLILDDVWEVRDFVPFKVAGPTSRQRAA